MIISNNLCVNLYSNPNHKVHSAPCFKGLNNIPRVVGDSFVSSKHVDKKGVCEVLNNILHPKNKLNSNIKEWILSTVSKNSNATGKDAIVFPIKEKKDLVLRVEKSAMENLESLSDDLVLVPIKYDKNVASNEHLGLPLYIVADKSSEIAKASSVSPQDALSQTNKLMVLKRVFGQHPSADYFDKFTEFIGSGDTPNVQQFLNFKILSHVRANYGMDATIKMLENCKNGVSIIEPNALAEGSERLELFEPKLFYKNYRAFVDSYKQSLKDISEFPQQSYDKAVNTILSKKDFIMDFQHTNNTFVDLDKKEFNFMDFVFDKAMYPKYHYDNPIKEFRNVLMGKCFSSKYPTPRAFIMMPEDIKFVKEYSSKINDKVNIASPDKFKSVSPFS